MMTLKFWRCAFQIPVVNNYVMLLLIFVANTVTNILKETSELIQTEDRFTSEMQIVHS